MDEPRFDLGELPVDILAQAGLDPDMIEDLPQKDLLDIELGALSPAVRIAVETEGGARREGRARFRLVRAGDGSVGVEFFPALEEDPVEDFPDDECETLKEGGCIVRDMPVKEAPEQCVCQIDRLTGRLFYAPLARLLPNIQKCASAFNLLASEIGLLKKGRQLQLTVKGTPLTIGLDLLCCKGIRCCVGNPGDWEEDKRKNYGKRNYGVSGCWEVDDEGAYDYIREEDYTDAMWDELSANAADNAKQSLI